MKRTIAFALMIPLLLSGCAARRAENRWRDWQQALREAEEVTFSAEITSRSGTDAVSFTAEICASGEEITTTVTAPDTIRGARFIASGEKTDLSCGEMTISLTALRPETLPPCSAAALLLSGARDGHLLWTSERGDSSVAAFTGPEETAVTLIRGPDGAVIAGEIARNGAAELSMRISDWHTKE